MAKFVKPVVKAGKYVVSTPNGGRAEATLTVDRMAKWVDAFNRLKAKGYRTPAPFDHLLEASPFRVGQAMNVPADKNGGFWNRLWLDGETLMGELESPGKASDHNSPASKVGTTVKETSVYAVPKWKDGTGEEYEEVLSHIALVVNPIEPGQANFQPVEGIALAMSQHIESGSDTRQPAANGDEGADYDDMDDDDANPGSDQGGIVKQIVKTLRDAEIGIDLPDDTNETNVLERLLVAARQKCVAKPQQQQQQPPQPPQPKPAPSLKKPPEGAVKEPTGVTMSTTPNPNPTPSPEHALLMSQVEALKAQNAQLTGLLMGSEANARAARIAGLLQSGRITKEYADKFLTPHLAGFQMSFGADGKPAKHVLDSLLEAVEAMPAPQRMNAGFGVPPQFNGISPALAMSLGIGATPAGVTPENNPTPSEPTYAVNDADATKIAAALLANV